ncbi:MULTISPECIES: helix-turn-helix domain-containing protein [Enterococcus]|uniref:helix-turn-helix domain-containing protein n=1 Tax=Enterococcus TaxID=1350 RepID=UPI0009004E89|nr:MULTISPECIES: helix-turn-helix domain-containing protein [Enterococcus]
MLLFAIGGIKIENQNSATKETYSINEIAQILDISNKTAYSLVHENLFRHVRIGKIIRISKKSFDQWLNNFADA